MTKNPLISVIIPIYNVEKYIHQCLDSVINQSYKNLEIILVDDGSIDKCSEICDEYAKKDKRIIIIHQENKGLSSARNTGLKYASGSYIAFVDSDDWLALNCYEKVLNHAIKTNAEITGYDIFEVYGNTIKVRSHTPNENAVIYTSQHYDLLFSLWPLVWSKLYKKSFLDKYQIYFPDGLIYEDVPFVVACYARNATMTFINDHLHYYRMSRVGSLSHKGNPKTSQIFDVMEFIKNDLKGIGKFGETYPSLVHHSASTILWLFELTPKNLRYQFYKKMQKHFKFYSKIAPHKMKEHLQFTILNEIINMNFIQYVLYQKLKKIFSIEASASRKQLICRIFGIKFKLHLKN